MPREEKNGSNNKKSSSIEKLGSRARETKNSTSSNGLAPPEIDDDDDDDEASSSIKQAFSHDGLEMPNDELAKLDEIKHQQRSNGLKSAGRNLINILSSSFGGSGNGNTHHQRRDKPLVSLV